MLRSDSLKQLIPALIAAQAEMDNPKKGKVNPAFKSGYADLGTVIECSREALAAQGLTVTHQIGTGYTHGDTGQFASADSLCTILWHTSGEFLGSVHPLRPVKNDPQGFGSAITYARRYSLMSLLGLAAEDDDGNAASARPSQANSIADKMRTKGSGFSAPTPKKEQ